MSTCANGTAQPLGEVKRCAVYTRKSTSVGLEQDFNSLDAQREACEQYIRVQIGDGWMLIDERYDDGGFTGANIERPAFRKLFEDIDAGKIDIVVVYKVDRLSRSLLDFARIMNRFNKAGVAFVSVTQNFSTADAMGRLTLNMLMSFAEFEREMISERTRDKITASRRKGKWTGGIVPLGYDVHEKQLVINELEAVTVREIFDLYLQRRSALMVAQDLNERGRTTKRHRAKNGNIRTGKPWTKQAVLRVLRNPIYAGYMPCGEDLFEGDHEAIIDREIFNRVRALLDGARPKTRWRGRNPDYILSGLLRCAHCGGAFTPASTRKKNREYRYYRCVTKDKQGRKECPSRPLPAGAIESFVIERIREATLDGRLVSDVAKRLQARMEKDRGSLETERRDLPKLIATLSAEGRRLVETIGQVTGAARRLLEDRIQEVGEELGRRERRLAEVERELALLDQAKIDADWVTRILSDFDKVWDVLTAENRQRLVRALVKEVVVDEPGGNVTATLVDLWDVSDGGPENETGESEIPVENMEART